MSLIGRAIVYLVKEATGNAAADFGKQIGDHVGQAIGKLLGKSIDPTHGDEPKKDDKGHDNEKVDNDVVVEE